MTDPSAPHSSAVNRTLGISSGGPNRLASISRRPEFRNIVGPVRWSVMAVVVGLLLVGLVEVSVAKAAQPTLESPQIGPSGVKLRLVGEAGKTYQLQESTNLVHWTPVSGVGSAVGGVTAEVALSPSRRFFRGIEVVASLPMLKVTPVVDSTLTAPSLITPELGGILETQDADGTIYSLVVPPLAVMDDVLARITVITNLTGIPSLQGYKWAVRLEPEGLVLMSPTFLSIRPQTPIAVTRVASYGFAADGSSFHLTPDLASTNEVRILVNRFESFGSGYFTKAEVQALRVRTAPSRATGRPRVTPQASMEECYPEDVAAAKALNAELTAKMRVIQQETAAEIAVMRQESLAGNEEAGSDVGALLKARLDFYNNELRPRLAAAAQRCAVATELLGWILGWMRQTQLLGGGDDTVDFRTTPEGQFLCAAMRRCEEQAEECCRTRGADTRLVVFLLGLERQRQLLGVAEGDCSTGNFWSSANKCMPDWSGTVEMTESYRVTQTQNRPGGVTSFSEEKKLRVFTQVANVRVEMNDADQTLGLPAFTNYNFKLVGTAKGAHMIRSFSKERGTGPCGAALPESQARPAARTPGRIAPQDDVNGTEELTLLDSELSTGVEFDVFVIVAPPEAASSGIKTSLQFVLEGFDTAYRGQRFSTTNAVDGSDCVTTRDRGPISGTDRYEGDFAFLEGGEFVHTPDRIAYRRKTVREGVTRELKIELVRLR